MNIPSHQWRAALAAALTVSSLLGSTPVLAGQNQTLLQNLAEDPDAAPWQEAEVPPPPMFNVDKVLPFDVSRNSELQHSIDPATLSIGSDEVVRYVRIARSSQGALNAVYEGLRCSSGEVRTYAYWNTGSGSWNITAKAPWRSLFNIAASMPAKALAYGGLCDGPSPNSTPDKMVRELRYGKKP